MSKIKMLKGILMSAMFLGGNAFAADDLGKTEGATKVLKSSKALKSTKISKTTPAKTTIQASDNMGVANLSAGLTKQPRDNVVTPIGSTVTDDIKAAALSNGSDQDEKKLGGSKNTPVPRNPQRQDEDKDSGLLADSTGNAPISKSGDDKKKDKEEKEKKDKKDKEDDGSPS